MTVDSGTGAPSRSTWSAAEDGLSVHGPEDVGLNVYLSRMGLADLLEGAGCSTRLPTVRHHPPDRFVLLRRFDAL